MGILLHASEPALNRGIKTSGIGKRGSKNLPPELIDEILTELKAGKGTAAAKGAFFASLFSKGITSEESRLEEAFAEGTLSNPSALLETLSPEAPIVVKDICRRLLDGETLDRATARRLGEFLFSGEPGDGARGMAAGILRVRYETPEEYDGLLSAMQDTLEKPFRTSVPAGDPVVQLSEPFDGVDHSYLITPLLARHIQSRGYRVITMVGRNSGPKAGINMLDVVKAMDADCAGGNQSLAQPKPEFGWFFNQQDLSKKIDRWVEIRRQIIKRPFPATLEKFLDPAGARIIVSSAFHPPYTEKMITVCEHAGVPGAIVVRNGIEGSLAFALKRPVKIMCSARQKDGSYLRHEFEFVPQEHLELEPAVEERVEDLRAQNNARLIVDFARHGRSGNSWFDSRTKISCLGLGMALDWLKKEIKG
jgi:anthranilate phosphoribosyltransferase